MFNLTLGEYNLNEKQSMKSNIEESLKRLTGQLIPFNENVGILQGIDENSLNWGYSQFNEILLYLGYNRISPTFFQFLVDKKLEYKIGSMIETLSQLDKSISSFIKIALLTHGNIKFAYRVFSNDSESATKEQSVIDKFLYLLKTSFIISVDKSCA